jgi:HEAT repeat protein
MATITLDREESEFSDLPRICMHCGREATRAVRHKFKWCPVWTPSPIIRMMMTKSRYVGIPVCDRHGAPSAWAGRWGQGIRASSIGDDSITLTGVSDDFADALEDYRRGLEPVVLDDEEREQRHKRRIRDAETDRPVPGASGNMVLWLVLGLAMAVPCMLCGGMLALRMALPTRPAPTSLFVIPTLPPAGQVPPRAALPEHVGVLAVSPHAGSPGSVPWPALAFTLSKEPIVLLSDADLDEILHELTVQDGVKPRAAALRLATAFPAERRRAEVAHALEPLTTDWSVFVRQSAAQALSVWATEDSAPSLIAVLKDKDSYCRHWAMRGLANLKDERGAAAVAQRLTDLSDRSEAAAALTKMGPVAEQPVVALLSHVDDRIRVEACNLLKVIGTHTSEPVLQKVADEDKSPVVKRAALAALQAVQGRT